MTIQEIPEEYLHRFRKCIPPSILCSLPNGKLIQGRYSKSKGKLFDLFEIVKYAQLEYGDFLVLTYWGSGQFDIIIFYSSKVEKFNQEHDSDIGKVTSCLDFYTFVLTLV